MYYCYFCSFYLFYFYNHSLPELCNESAVWSHSVLGEAQLHQSMVKEGIDSYIKVIVRRIKIIIINMLMTISPRLTTPVLT